MQDTIQSIRLSSRRFLSGTLLSRLTGMFRDMSMAYAFGTQPSIAAFMVAFRFAHLLRRLFGEGALQSAFVPEFETLRNENETKAFTFFRDLSGMLTLFLTFLIGLGCIGLAACLKWGNFSEDNQEILTLTLIMLPSLLFICLYGINASLLQCEKQYFIPGVAPVAFNAAWIITIFAIQHMSASKAMPWLAFGVVIACFFQWFMTIPSTWNSLKKSFTTASLSLIPRFSKELKGLIKPLTLGILGVAASQINNAVDTLFARYADVEGPAILWYAIRIQQLPLALFGIAIAGAVLPPLSRAIKGNRQEEYQNFLSDALNQTYSLILPLTALLFLMGDCGVNLLYGRGGFGPESVIQTTYCLWAYGFGLLPSALILILAPAFYARRDYIIPAYASFIAMALNLILNYLFIIQLGWGPISVAFATSLSSWVNVFFLTYRLKSMGVSFFSGDSVQNLSLLGMFTCLSFCIAYSCRILFLKLPFFSEKLLSASFFEQTLIDAVLLIIFGSSLFFLYNLKTRLVLIFRK